MRKNVPAGNPQPRRTGPLDGCPLAAAFDAFGGRWKLTVLYWLAHGELHFAGLRRRLAPISSKVLAQQLRALETEGLIERRRTGDTPAPVFYELTAYGRTLLPIVEGVRVWGEDHLRRTGRPPRQDGLACARRVDPAHAASTPAVRIDRRDSSAIAAGS